MHLKLKAYKLQAYRKRKLYKKTLYGSQEKKNNAKQLSDQLFNTSLFWDAIYLENPYTREKQPFRKINHNKTRTHSLLLVAAAVKMHLAIVAAVATAVSLEGIVRCWRHDI